MTAAPHAKPHPLPTDLLLVALLIGLDIAARLLPHAPSVSPVAASALFAGMVLRRRSLALAVPLIAMPLGDLVLGFYHWQVMVTVYAALTAPALIGMLVRRYPTAYAVVPSVLGGSLLFFVSTNLAVWAFSGLYPLDGAGLLQCYLAGLPFLKYTVTGDLFWAAALFGGALLVQRLSASAARTS